ncbi:MAG: ABC transporter ATP-binding protein [Bacteroidota bacterium]
MARIVAQNISLNLPIYNFHARSLKKTLLRIGTGGRISAESQYVIVEALRDVSFEIENGDRVALVGRNGAGKTTLLRTLAGVYHPTAGTLTTEGKVVPLLTVGVGMVEEFSGYENILAGALHVGLNREQALSLQEEIAEFTELGDYLELPIHTYSAGMRARLSFAIATAITPEILLLDEGIGAGDAFFAAKAQARFERMMTDSSIMVLASHDENLVRGFCNKALLFDNGRLLDFGPVDNILAAYHSGPA